MLIVHNKVPSVKDKMVEASPDMADKSSGTDCLGMERDSDDGLMPIDFEDDEPIPSGIECPFRVRTNSISQPELTKTVILNIGGQIHEVLWVTLDRFPKTKLGKLRACKNDAKALWKTCQAVYIKDNVYFFDKSPKSFGSILDMYRTKCLHFDDEVCVMDFKLDLDYWGVDEKNLDTCCRARFQKKRDSVSERLKKLENMEDPTELLWPYKNTDFGMGKLAPLRKFLWDIFERPFYRPAQVMSILSVAMILLSIVIFCLSTVSHFQEYECIYPNKTLCKLVNFGTLGPLIEKDGPIKETDFVLKDNWKMKILERICIMWFTIEYLLRLIACPDRWSFIKHPLNIIDLFAFLPYYCSLLLILFHFSYPTPTIQILFVFRVLRILKLARHSTGLQSLGYTVKRSWQDIGVLLLFIVVAVVISSSLVYYAERGVNPSFDSIPGSFWWALITITTVGYGDVAPITVLGRAVGMVTAVCGVIVVAMPIALTMNSFAAFYEQQREREKLLRLHKRYFRDKYGKVNNSQEL